MRKQVRSATQASVQSLEARCFFNATLVKDIDPTPGGEVSPGGLTVAGSIAYFAQLDATHGYELFRTDGTAAGTVLVKDINPGKPFSFPANFTAAGSSTFFTADDGVHGTELWKTDGTEAGTTLVKDVNSGIASGGGVYLAASGSKVFFWANDGTTGAELWVSDGTSSGTHLISDLRPGSASQSVSPMVTLNGYAYFRASNGTQSALYKTDGTAAGTSVVTLLNGSSTNVPLASFDHPTVLGNRVFFSDALGYVFAIDGTSGATIRLEATNRTVGAIVAAGTNLFFTKGDSLYRVSNNASSAVAITGATPFTAPTNLTTINGILYFTAQQSTGGAAIFYVPGSLFLPSKFSDSGSAYSSPAALTPVGNQVYFTAYDNDGATRLRMFNPTTQSSVTTITTLRSATTSGWSEFPNSLVGLGSNLLFFNYDPATTGLELWESSGTAATTGTLRDLSPGTNGSNAFPLASVGNKVLISAYTPTTGTEPWISDGTAAGTVLLTDLNPGVGGSLPRALGSIGGRLLFSAATSALGTELYVTDGTAAGTTLVKDIQPGTGSSSPEGFILFNGYAYFAATTSANGEELWRTDGTAAGTMMVADIRSGTTGDGIDGGSLLAVANGRLFFRSAYTVNGGEELWSTDGTPAGTSRVADIYAGSPDSAPNNFFVVGGNTLYFSATNSSSGTELWRSDGTPAGTVRVADVRPGSASSSPVPLFALGDTLYFIANDGTTGTELWKTDGTPTGTTRVVDLTPGSGSTSFGSGVQFKGKFYFAAGLNGAVSDLYVTDGTATGTQIVQSFAGTDFGIFSLPLKVSGGRILFQADGVGHGMEPWESDGTTAGTHRIDDIGPGAINGQLSPIVELPGGAGALAGASDILHGDELWLLSDDVAPAVFLPSFSVDAPTPELDLPVTESVAGSLASASITLLNRTTGVAIDPSKMAISYDGAAAMIRVRYVGGGALPDGHYRLTVGGLADAAGNVMSVPTTYDFDALAGDANRDGVVDFNDMLVLAKNYNGFGRTFSQGNFDYSPDGSVDFDDLLVLAKHYNTSLPPAAASATSDATRRRSRAADDVIT